MASELMEALTTLCQEKHIDELYLLSELEKTLADSYAETMHMPFGGHATIDRQTGKIYIYEKVPVGEEDENGDYAEFDLKDVTPDNASWTAARKAKSLVSELVRESRRKDIYSEFAERIGDLITGTVVQSTNDFTILKIREGVEAELPHFDLRRHPNERNERPARERYRRGEQLRAVVIDVRAPDDNVARNDRSRPQIVVSRTCKEFVPLIFELEVPEVYDGDVVIRGVARDPGHRCKVAVDTDRRRVDPVGACIGTKGARIKEVVRELRGERVDMLRWSPDPAAYLAAAMKPATVNRVIIAPDGKHATVIVPDDQLAMAIGKKGQNARLAAMLTGLSIDIKTPEMAIDLVSAAEEEEAELDTRCAYIGANGQRCRNSVAPGSRYCRIHEQIAAAEGYVPSDDPDSLI